ncbi:MAG: DUF4136 domain-containing protein [Terriglobia bacterium]
MATGRMITVLLSLTLLTVDVFAQKVSTDYDHNTHFAKFKTYAWAPSKNPAKNPLWNQRITENIDRQLAEKGLKRVDTGADLFVTYNGGIKENMSLQGFGPGGRWSGGPFSVNRVTELEGTLIVDLYDVPAKQLVWRGVATETVSDKTEKNIARLEKVVAKLFKDFPPKAK